MNDIRLAHNHDTAFKILAKMVNDDLKKIYNHNHPELSLCEKNIVSIATNGMNVDIENIISKLNHKNGDLLPRVIFAKSNAINPTQLGKTSKKFQMMQSVRFVNIEDSSDSFQLSGQSFSYETPAQVVILARSGFAVMEIALNIINILGNNHTIKYDMMVKDKEDESKKFLLKDMGVLSLANVDMMSFSESTVQQSGMIAIASEFSLRNRYFIFRDDNGIMLNYKVEDRHTDTNIDSSNL